MGDRKQQARERAAKLAEMRAGQARQERRQKFLIYGVVAVVCLALVTAVAVPLINQARRQSVIEATAGAPLEGVELIEIASSNHVPGTVDYQTSPPAGGDHNGVWQNCGVYTEPVVNENAVHSLEHGAVWLTYSGDLPEDQVSALADRAAQGQGYVLVSPYQDQSTPIVLSAWGAQLTVDDADDPRVDAFLMEYLQGAQTPEPGAPCYGGTGTPAA
ncbi:Protein of unknown function [Georgenia satyanarayanai]|uniref:DUF3105 domain-containing protein n=1 Tax=Georgenia satyanarayanai TaxID=860221 RepID=A0A2Y9AR67_9MICO|nr:DUF3105 domain-containing protein [Georgenia satyanarayanai]PYF96353.1 uncharacterized protein DUF3105 [Georgenia satyanarayanai]SSA46884.1 Protein of unknown function [Georgenia satyanarayanai]